GLHVVSLRADRDADDQVLAALAVLVAAATVLAALAFQCALQGDVEQGRLALVADEDDVASLAAVAARRTAERDVLLPAERDAAVAPGPGQDLHLARIDELHGGAGCSTVPLVRAYDRRAKVGGPVVLGGKGHHDGGADLGRRVDRDRHLHH